MFRLTASHSLNAKSKLPLKLSLCWNQSLPFALTSVRDSGEVGLPCIGRSSRYVRTAIPRPQSLSLTKGSLENVRLDRCRSVQDLLDAHLRPVFPVTVCVSAKE